MDMLPDVFPASAPTIRRKRGTAPPRNAIEVPKGLVFLCDSNEYAGDHLGYDLQPRLEKKLLVGDYSVQTPGGLSLEGEVAVERKSLVNILGDSVGDNRERFERCLARLAEVKYRAMVIEADWRKLRGAFEHTRVDANAVRGSLIAWSVRFGVAIWLAGDRSEGQELTKRLLLRAHLEHARRTQDGQQVVS
jgi:ERCC4-type nuclease